MVPPFTVLSAREGWWQQRKAAWLALGLEGEVGRYAPTGGSPLPLSKERKGYAKEPRGRAVGLTYRDGAGEPDFYRNREPDGRPAGLTFRTGPYEAEYNNGGTINSTSIFDPVLCELAYRWWCPPGGQIIDPFAGGACRGVVAHVLGFQYWGCDLRQEQVDANEKQAATICPESRPAWKCGDARDVLVDAPGADFLFTCPPYGDLEQYSEDPRDLSAMTLADFKAAYMEIIQKAAARLKPDRFAAVVVGDYRDKDGMYVGFPAGTAAAFRRAGMHLYNEAILVTAVASASMRATQQFRRSRKLVKTHQNILVFVKGDWRRAVELCAAADENPET